MSKTNPTEALRMKIRNAIADALSDNSGKCLDNEEEFHIVQRSITRAVEKELNITEPTQLDWLDAAKAKLASAFDESDFNLESTVDRAEAGAWVTARIWVSEGEV
jgi:hypothetical protein